MKIPALLGKYTTKEKSMVSEASGSIAPFRHGVHAHFIQEEIPVIVLREIQFERRVETMLPITPNRAVRRGNKHAAPLSVTVFRPSAPNDAAPIRHTAGGFLVAV